MPEPSAESPGSRWIEATLPSLWRFLRRLGCSREVAEDLAQDACLAALEKGVHGWPDPQAMAWVIASARNLFRAHLRANGRRPRLLESPASWPQQELAEPAFAQLRGALRRCLLQLAPRARRALEMRYRHGAGRVEIGREIGIRAQGVKALLQRTRNQLRQCIARNSDDA